MRFPPAALVALVRLLRRDGIRFPAKCVRYVFFRDAWVWLLRGGKQAARSAPPAKGPVIPVFRPMYIPPEATPEERERSRRVLLGYAPKVSVVVTSYNYAHVLRETLDSLVAQTYRNFEVLVVDNGSADDSVSIIREYAARDSRFRLLQHEGGVNKGLPASVKLGVEEATGEFVAFCEADDLWTPEHLERKIELLRENWADPDFIVNDIAPFGDEIRCRQIAPMMETRRPALQRERNRISPVEFRKRNWIFTFSMCMVRRSVLRGCDFLSVPRPSNLDWWLWRQVCLDRDVWCVHEKLTKWRLHGTSFTVRDQSADSAIIGFDLVARMDRLLVERHPDKAESLVPFLRAEDDFRCREGKLERDGLPVAGPSFSVVLPVAGPGGAWKRSMESLAAQTYADFEVILVNGPDATPTETGSFPVPVRRIAGEEEGLPALFANGEAAATGDWTILLPPGDTLQPEGLQVFAARAFLAPTAPALFAMSQRRNRVLEDAFGNLFPGKDGEHFPFSPLGAIAFRHSAGPVSGVEKGDDFQLRAVLPFSRNPDAVFVDHRVGVYDDGPDGRDPDALVFLRDEAEFIRLRGNPPAARPSAGPSRVRTACRNAFVFLGKCFKYSLSPAAWRWLLRGGYRRAVTTPPPELALIRNSRWFDADWYLLNNPDALHAGVDPAANYLQCGHRTDRNPGPDFVGDEYLALNPEAGCMKVHPLVHFEQHGRREGRLISFLENDAPPVFPKGTVETRRTFGPFPPGKRRTAVFAGYFSDGRIPETDLFFLRGLREIADNVVYVCNNPIFPDELAKLDGLVCAAAFEVHGEYDFGSYKRGWSFAKENGLLDPAVCDEAVLANDSCYGPVYPFAEAFSKMAGNPCDFWGLSSVPFLGRNHLQSFFFVFRRRVLDGGELDAFLRGVTRQPARGYVVMRYEFRLTALLVDAGFRVASFLPADFRDRHRFVPSRMPVTTMEQYRFPLLKVKAVNGDSDEDVEKALRIVARDNPELRKLIRRGSTERAHRRISLGGYRASFPARIEAIRKERIARGLPVRAVFLVSSASMFPARPLFDAMRRDAAFDAKMFVVPDMRWWDRDPESARRECRADLGATIPEDRFLEAAHDEFGLWPDVLADADIVCYPSPYDLSCFRFNPHWSVGRNFLPMHVNYGFYRSAYDREVMQRQNYAWFWKAFFECEATAKEYAVHSILKGANAEVVGYVKMDALAGAKPWPRNGSRKRVLIAPHHSVEGGANDTLALSNFARYADFFLALPAKHPELDFVFRPHPFLFTVLSHPSKWGPEMVSNWIERMKAHPNVRWSDEGDYFPVFASCDACVQDCGSYLVEWFYTGKPCCYMLKDPSDIDAKFAPLGKDCLSLCYLAYDEAAIESFLRDVVEGGADPKAAARDEFRRSVMVNYPHAADAALASIKRALGMA